jgi:hypothetical protein
MPRKPLDAEKLHTLLYKLACAESPSLKPVAWLALSNAQRRSWQRFAQAIEDYYADEE